MPILTLTDTTHRQNNTKPTRRHCSSHIEASGCRSNSLTHLLARCRSFPPPASRLSNVTRQRLRIAQSLAPLVRSLRPTAAGVCRSPSAVSPCHHRDYCCFLSDNIYRWIAVQVFQSASLLLTTKKKHKTAPEFWGQNQPFFTFEVLLQRKTLPKKITAFASA